VLESTVSDCGLRLRRLERKAEKAALSAQRAKLLAALHLEASPPACLALAVPLLFHKATGGAGGLGQTTDEAGRAMRWQVPASITPGRVTGRQAQERRSSPAAAARCGAQGRAARRGDSCRAPAWACQAAAAGRAGGLPPPTPPGLPHTAAPWSGVASC